MRFEPYEYQRAAMRWIREHPRCGLFLDMGLGKTVSTLTAILDMMDEAELDRVLVVAPKKVAEATWSTEAGKWDHLRGLKVVKVLGSERQRIAALEQKADVYVLGRDNFVWLAKHYNGRMPFDMLVIDELTSFKSHGSQRFKAMRLVAPSFRRVVGLTGTPAPNGLIDLWAQLYCLDQGERLGRTFSQYRDAYFHTQTWNNIAIRYEPKKGCADLIRRKIGDICLSMKAEDYLQLPELITHTERLRLSEKAMKAYEEFERQNVIEFHEKHGEEAATVLATSAAALMNKLSQFSNGAVYDAEHNVHTVHDEKLDRLAEIVEAAHGGVLVFYQYRHDIPRIKERLEGYKVRTFDGEADLIDWNAGKIEVLLAHPSSTAYGLNMQEGGHYIVWFGLGWNLELYQQANARLHRQGQQYPVIIYRLLCDGTVDEMAERALGRKGSTQQSLLDGLKYLTEKYMEHGTEEEGEGEH